VVLAFPCYLGTGEAMGIPRTTNAMKAYPVLDIIASRSIPLISPNIPGSKMCRPSREGQAPERVLPQTYDREVSSMIEEYLFPLPESIKREIIPIADPLGRLSGSSFATRKRTRQRLRARY
jgi:hypothetical protein